MAAKDWILDYTVNTGNSTLAGCHNMLLIITSGDSFSAAAHL